MKLLTAVFASLFFAGLASSHANLYTVELSPGPGVALNLGANVYVQDHGLGLSGLNEPGILAAAGSGNTVGGGITYDDVSNVLTFNFAYGSAFGFTDLVGDLTVLHFHGPGDVNFPAANSNGVVILNLAPFHTAVGTKSGLITGSTILSDPNESHLLNNKIYANIHSTVQPGGEIRGQLILVPEPSSVLLGLFGTAALAAIRRRRQ